MRLNPKIAGVLMAFVAAIPAANCFAQNTQASAPVPVTPVEVPKLDADLENSRVYIKVTSGSRLGHDHGVAGRLESGWVKPGAGGEIVFAMKTFITDTPDARKYVGLTAQIKSADQKKSSQNMLGVDVLDVQKYPRATFKINSFDPTDGQAAGAPGGYQLNGTFTLHGVSKALAIKAKLEPTTGRSVYRLRGSFAILQSQFGITPYSALGGMVSIEDRLDIWGEFVFRESAIQANAPAPRVTR